MNDLSFVGCIQPGVAEWQTAFVFISKNSKTHCHPHFGGCLNDEYIHINLPDTFQDLTHVFLNE